ncbi:MAG: PqqD family protein [Candidatus Fermentibacteraceae bacterium]|nr:PqqD family protein [Candidatus Fermentibacteraceae bacterium]
MEKIRYPENVVFREEPEGGILFDVNTGKLKLVEDVAWGICNLIDKGKTRTAILRELEKLYPEETTLENDLDSLLDELVETGFLISLEED